MDTDGEYPPTGTYEDLMLLLAREEAKRRTSLPRKTALGRAVWEPPWNLVGLCLGAAARLLPSSVSLDLQDRLFLAIEGGRPAAPFDPEAAGLRRAGELRASASRESGVEASVLCLQAHAPDDPKLLHVNLALARHAVRGLRRLGCPRPQLVVAVDRFALDTLAHYEEAAYAGYMCLANAGFDRLAHLRRGAGRWLLSSAAWPRAVPRLVGSLAQGRGAILVPSGGIPATGRIHYCLRESLASLRRRAPGRREPSAVLRRLADASDSFSRFLKNGPVGAGLRRSAWRMMEAWVVSELLENGGLSGADRGELLAPAREAAKAAAEALGWEREEVESSLEALAAEFKRKIPYRERFFQVAARRAVSAGRPMLLVPLTFGLGGGSVEPKWGEPAALMGMDGDRVRLLTLDGARRVPLPEFCREFIGSRFD